MNLVIATLVGLSLTLVSPSANQPQQQVDGASIDRITGAKGTYNETEKVHKVSFPRDDVPVTVDGVRMPPFMGLTSWAAFKPGVEAQAMVMGDIVLFQDEVSPAMSAALDNGLTVTALHNHFFYDDPKVYFMHIGGEGTTEQLATGVRKVLDRVRQVREKSGAPAKGFGHDPLPERSSLTAAPLDAIIGHTGTEKDGMVKFTIGRTTRMPCGCEVGKEMGVNTWAAFFGSPEHAIVDGDFVTFEGELQPVLKALRANDINVVAIHNHMEGETPRAIFLHYWGVGPAEKLARAVKAALDAQGAAAPAHEHDAAHGGNRVPATPGGGEPEKGLPGFDLVASVWLRTAEDGYAPTAEG